VAGIIYAVPRPPVPVPVNPWVRTRVTWTGWDGSIWDLTDPDGGVVLLRDGVEGLHMPKFKEWVRQSPAVPGQTFSGAIAEKRTVVLPLAVYEDTTSAAWVERDAAFWRSMHPRRQGTLTISPAGTGRSRSIRLRLQPEDHTYGLDPAFARWAEYSAVLIADQPFWEGLPVRAGWGAAPPQDFYETEGPHLVNLMTGHTTAAADLTNDGDEDAWPVWTVIGPSSATHMGTGTDIVEIPFDIPEGKAVVLDTDPRIRTALEYDYVPAAGELPEAFLNPMDRTADLTGAVKFSRIPAGTTTPVNVSLAGNGQLRVVLIPLYWRAW
jgi:hypothetical protein